MAEDTLRWITVSRLRAVHPLPCNGLIRNLLSVSSKGCQWLTQGLPAPMLALRQGVSWTALHHIIKPVGIPNSYQKQHWSLQRTAQHTCYASIYAITLHLCIQNTILRRRFMPVPCTHQANMTCSCWQRLAQGF